MNLPLSNSLFGRTFIIIAAALSAYFLLTWIALVWAVVVPAASSTGHLLSERAEATLQAPQGTALPEGVSWETRTAAPPQRRLAGLALSYYLDLVTREVANELPGSRIVVTRAAGPSEMWLQPPGGGTRWIRLTWSIIRPEAPIAAIVAMGMGALVVIGFASISARRLAKPLAALTAAAERVARGDPMPVDTTAGPIEVRELAVAFDSMSRRLGELEDQRELMLAGVSHDLRSPLARLRVAVELLDPRDCALLRNMTLDIDEMDRMVGQFLHYVRANYREPGAVRVPDAVVRSALALYLGNGGLSLALAAPLACRLPENTLRHIALNLVQNALDYGVAPVVVGTRVEENRLLLSVEDHGPGLSPPEWREAVRPFRRLRETEAGHTGLGLAMVDRLVSACGGSWGCTRTAEVFRVEVALPVNSSAAPPLDVERPLDAAPDQNL